MVNGLTGKCPCKDSVDKNKWTINSSKKPQDMWVKYGCVFSFTVDGYNPLVYKIRNTKSVSNSTDIHKDIIAELSASIKSSTESGGSAASKTISPTTPTNLNSVAELQLSLNSTSAFNKKSKAERDSLLKLITETVNQEISAVKVYNDDKTNFLNALKGIQPLADIADVINSLAFSPYKSTKQIKNGIATSGIIKDFLDKTEPKEDSITRAVLIKFVNEKSKAIKKSFGILEISYKIIINKFKELKVFSREQLAEKDSLANEFSSLQNKFSSYKPSEAETLANKLGDILDVVTTDNLNQFSNNLTIEDDKTVLTYFAEPIDSKITGAKKDSVSFTVRAKGKFKMFTTTGLSLILGSNSIDKNYYFDTDSIIKSGKKVNQFTPFITLMSNFYFTSEKMVNPGFSLGVSSNVTKLFDLRFLFGPSLIIGHDDKFVLSAGISGGSVNGLNSNYNEGKKYTPTISTSTTGINEKHLRIGSFISVSYSFK